MAIDFNQADKLMWMRAEAVKAAATVPVPIVAGHPSPAPGLLAFRAHMIAHYIYGGEDRYLRYAEAQQPGPPSTCAIACCPFSGAAE